ncbi:hypothetical protein B9Z19DRAFT_58349 [Tuber borchii]|uniref:Uncharacterized protein n=1 Tax=Tuber borchii TaxID=42251 RepID=A0A2T6ZSZ1_TUBBO|nr:hypothetical protein B9Z19DRAFT_58349 [Tuber borchii]
MIFEFTHLLTQEHGKRKGGGPNEQLREKAMITSIIHKTAPSERKREMFPQKSKRQSTGPMHPKLRKKST